MSRQGAVADALVPRCSLSVASEGSQVSRAGWPGCSEASAASSSPPLWLSARDPSDSEHSTGSRQRLLSANPTLKNEFPQRAGLTAVQSSLRLS